MQLDMHYYGTYAMARAAEMAKEHAEIVATAAQFVDDNAFTSDVRFKDGGRIDYEATAHHTVDHKNLDDADQRKVWVPFHFFPGNVGDEFTARLMCTKDGTLVNEMIDHHLEFAHAPYALELLGIIAHIYADTFAHYGFSGIRSTKNRIASGSLRYEGVSTEVAQYLDEKARKFNREHGDSLFDNIKSFFAETLSGALGHGAALTYPDRPFIKWSVPHRAK